MKAADERQRPDADRPNAALSHDAEQRLRQAFVARYGWERGIEVWRDVVAYAWQHRDRLSTMKNPIGYLYRVGQSAARRHRRMSRQVLLPEPDTEDFPHVEPGLAYALSSLSERQRLAVLLVHAHGWTHEAAAEIVGVSKSTLRNHLARGLTRLRDQLGVEDA
jgi:DNA-directed RNA polymerase specialized sigma24 family protein